MKITKSKSSVYNIYDVGNLYDNFLTSLDEVNEKKMLMEHPRKAIADASKLFDGYLTDEELQERQYEGRFWDTFLGYLYILVDDDTLVIIEAADPKNYEIAGRDKLPIHMRGIHYYEDYRHT